MSQAPAVHPTPEALTAFGLGKLTDAETDAIARHLTGCDECRRRVEGVAPDSLVGLVRSSQQGTVLYGGHPAAPPRPQAGPARTADRGEAPPAADLPPELAGHPRYRIVRVLGQGGMGVVYEAEHRHMARKVALKVIHRSFVDRPEAVERFGREVRAAAKLSHPNIVTAHDAEQAGDLHLLVMEYVEGWSLAQVLEKKGPLPVAHACHYIRQAALGLEHACEQGMVHRDLKPQNLMLTPKGQVKILDFGLARLASEKTAGPGLTAEDAVMGTPEYLAPEQALDARQADIRADIYSLGCTLYCLLAGQPPYPEGTALQKVMAHLEKELRPLTELRPDVPAALWAVIQRMLAREPAQRYQRPVEVAQALVPFIKAGAKARPSAAPVAPGETSPSGTETPRVAASRSATLGGVAKGEVASALPVGGPAAAEVFAELTAPRESAKPGARTSPKARPRGRLPRWAWVAAGAGALAAVLIAGIVLSIRTDKGTVEIRLSDPDAKVDIQVDGDTVQIRGVGQPLQLRVGEHHLRVAGEGYETVTQSFTVKRGGNPLLVVELKKPPNDPPPGEPPSGPMTGPLSPLALVSQPVRIPGVQSWTIETRQHRSDVRAVAYSPDGRCLATAGGDGSIRFWDTDHYQLQRILLGHRDSVLCLAWSPDGKTLASGSRDKTIRLWEAESGRLLRTLEGHSGVVSMLAWAAHGKILASGSRDDYLFRYPDTSRLADQNGDGTVRLWNPDSGRLKLTLPVKDFASLAWSRDGKILAIRAGKSMDLLDPNSGKVIKHVENEVGSATSAPGLAWSSKGTNLAAAGKVPGHVVVWDPETGKTVHDLSPRKGSPLPPSDIYSLAWSPDAKTLACGYFGNVAGLVLCDAESGKRLHSLDIEPPGTVLSIAWSPDGKSLAAALGDRAFVRIWQAETGKILHNLDGQQPITRGLAYPPAGKGRPIGFSFTNDRLRAIDLDAGRIRSSLPCSRSWDDTAAITPDGKVIAATTGGADIQVWEPAGGPAFQSIKVSPAQKDSAQALAVAWSPDGKLLASGHADHTVRLWGPGASGVLRNRRSLQGHQGRVRCLAWSPAGELLASGSDDQSIRVWDAEAGKSVHVLSAPNHKVRALRWSPDGTTLASGNEDGSVDLWDPSAERLLASLHGHERPVSALAWSPDGKTLASAGMDRKLQQWDITSGKTVRTLPGATDGRSVYWSADGKTLISVLDGSVRFWDADNGALRQTLLPLREEQSLAVSSTGHYRGGLWIEREIVYVVQTAQGHVTLSPDEFAKKYNWKNDPERARPFPDQGQTTPQRPDGPVPDSVPTGEPLSPLALVSEPARINGVQSWTIETVGHRGAVRCLAYSPDGRWLAIGGDDGVLRLRDAQTNELGHVFVTSAKEIVSLHWSADSKTLASLNSDQIVDVWQPESGKLARRTVVNAAGNWVDWAPDNKVIAIGSNSPLLKFVQLESGQISAIKGEGGWHLRFAWSPDGQRIATAPEAGGVVQIQDARSGKVLLSLEPYNDHIQALAWSPDGKAIAVGGSSSNVVLSDGNTGKKILTMGGHSGVVFQLAWSPDGKILATGSNDGTARLWDVKAGKQLQLLQHGPFPQWRRTLAWSPDGKRLATSDGATVRTWQTKTGTLFHVIEGTAAFAGSPIWSKDQTTLAFGNHPRAGNTIVRLLNLETGAMRQTSAWAHSGPNRIALSPDGKTIAAGTVTSHVPLFDAATGQVLRGLQDGEGQPPVLAAEWSPDGDTLAVSHADKRGIRLWQPATGQLLRRLEGSKGSVQALAWSPDGKTLAAAGADPVVRLWDPSSGKLRKDLVQERCETVSLAWSPDGKALVSGNADGTIRLWDVASGSPLETLRGHTGAVVSLGWLPDGKMVASSSADKTVRLWKAPTGQLVRTIVGPSAGTLSPDCRWLASSSGRALQLWEIESGRLGATLIAMENAQWFALTPQGHLRGSPQVERRLVYTVQANGTQQTLTPQEFATKYNWKNDPKRVRLVEGSNMNPPGPVGPRSSR